MNFVPLHVRSGYSFLASGLTVEKIITTALTRGFSTIGIADIHAMFGWGEFALACKQNKLKPIFGIDLVIEDISLTLIVNDEQGYRHLTQLSTLIAQRPLMLADFVNVDTHLVAIVSSKESQLASLLIDDKLAAAKLMLKVSTVFQNFYIGLEINQSIDTASADLAREFAKKYDYKTLAFPLIKYQTPADAIILDIVSAIKNEEKRSEKVLTGPHYFLTDVELESLYSAAELDQTISLGQTTTFDFHQSRGELLRFPLEEGITNAQTLSILVEDGCKKRKLNINDFAIKSRLDYELSVISSMGYNDYFLIVADYVNFAKSKGILVGPGRGSAAGSLVSFVLGITEINPFPDDLLFERFLNPERQSMPDIDIDFEDDHRDEIVNYLRQKYGPERVANIITFITIGAKQSLRDIGRVFNYPVRDIDLLSKSIGNVQLGLHDAYRQISAFRKLVDSDKYYLEIVSLASKITGLPRQSGIHAAGLILNQQPLTTCLPMTVDSNGNTITQFEMANLEAQGFLKMDILGLTNLSTIRKCLELIQLNHHLVLNLDDLPYQEPAIFELISAGHTMGIFQLETSGMQNAIARIQPSCFADVVATIALFRPGPMQNIDLYVARKNSAATIKYPVPALAPILKPTYGIMVYQEQIMQIAQVFAGMSLAQADLFRRAISKKDLSKLEHLKKDFLQGAKANNHDQSLAETIFDDILKFADYGFNKSHSVAYGRLACQMAYLKVHYPAEFYAAVLGVTNASNDTKFQNVISEMRARKIKLLAPDINRSLKQFTVIEKQLLLPLTAVKGINNATLEHIFTQRNFGPFSSFMDFVVRTFGLVSAKQIESLIDAGSFDQLHTSRATLRGNMDKILQYASNLPRSQENGLVQIGLLPPPAIIAKEDQILENLEKEFEAIGLMLSANPLDFYRQTVIDKKISSITQAFASPQSANHRIAGMIKQVKIIRTKKGDQMAFVTLFDTEAELEVTVFPETYTNVYQLLERNAIVIVEGRFNEFKPGSFNATSLRLLENKS